MKRQIDVWVGIYKPDNEAATWSASVERRYCRFYLGEVYSEEEMRRDIRIVRATLTLNQPKQKRAKK
jgi:hypothetical protein